jgi:excisionase family DNA binding protein
MPVEQAASPVGRRLCTVPEAMRRLGISKTTIFRLLGEGELESMQIGRARRIPADAIDTYITRNTTPAAAG